MSEINESARPKQKWSRISILGLIQVIGLVPFVGTFIAFAGRWHWVADLFSHFRMQYVIILSVVGLLLAYVKSRKLAAVYAIGAVINAIIVFPMYLPTGGAIDATRPTLKLMHLNAYVGNRNYDEVAAYFDAQQADLIFIQELHMRMDDRLKTLKHYRMVVSQPNHNAWGIGMLIRRDAETNLLIDNVEIQDITDEYSGRPAIMADVRWHDQPISLLSLHTMPPRSSRLTMIRDAQLAAAAQWINRQTNPTILIGDLNTTPWSWSLQRLIRDTGLRNSQLGFGVQASWRADAGPIGKIPIDHCLHSDHWVTVGRRIGDNVHSDHLSLHVELQLAE